MPRTYGVSSGSLAKRRGSALQRLSTQLDNGTKILSTKGIVKMPFDEFEALSKEPSSKVITVPLTDKDKIRIEKEITTLKLRGAKI